MSRQIAVLDSLKGSQLPTLFGTTSYHDKLPRHGDNGDNGDNGVNDVHGTDHPDNVISCRTVSYHILPHESFPFSPVIHRSQTLFLFLYLYPYPCLYVFRWTLICEDLERLVTVDWYVESFSRGSIRMTTGIQH